MARRAKHQAYTAAEIEQARFELAANERALALLEAQEDLIRFAEVTMPHTKYPDNIHLTRYDAQKHHRALAAVMEKVFEGEIKRLIVTFPPRHGKSELTSRRFPAWALGKDPHKHIVVGSYNSDFVQDFGRDVRGIMESPAYKAVFPNCHLQKGSKSAERLRTATTAGGADGGQIVFVGRGGSITGRGGDIIIIDDPIKNRAEAKSETIRNEAWDWLNDDVLTRFMTDEGVIVIIVTRWHEDDVVGRLIDPDNPHYNADEAAQWKVFNVPAIAEELDPLGREPGEALWPSRFGIDYLKGFERRNPRGFASLYQQQPTPIDGDLFTSDMFVTYKREDLPPLNEMRIYAASDHALTEKDENDPNVFGVVGVDKNGFIYILDVWWKRAKSDKQVEQMLLMADKWRPIIWWAEADHITKAIGPFLKRRMYAEKNYFNLVEIPTQRDKVSKGQSFVSYAAMGMIRFPEHAPWRERAKSELLKMPNGTHDDFWDFLSNIGRGLHIMQGGGNSKPRKPPPKPGTLSWIKKDSAYRRLADTRTKAMRGH